MRSGVGTGEVQLPSFRDQCHGKTINYLVLWVWQVFLIPPVFHCHSEKPRRRGPALTPGQKKRQRSEAPVLYSHPSQSSHPLGQQAASTVPLKKNSVKFKGLMLRLRGGWGSRICFDHITASLLSEKPFINLTYRTGAVVEATAGQKSFKLQVNVSAFPTAEAQW